MNLIWVQKVLSSVLIKEMLNYCYSNIQVFWSSPPAAVNTGVRTPLGVTRHWEGVTRCHLKNEEYFLHSMRILCFSLASFTCFHLFSWHFDAIPHLNQIPTFLHIFSTFKTFSSLLTLPSLYPPTAASVHPLLPLLTLSHHISHIFLPILLHFTIFHAHFCHS